jgi:hypothetical protein
MFNFNKENKVFISKDNADILFSIYTDMMRWVNDNREYQDVEKCESEAKVIKEILDQTDYEFEYKRGF